MAGFANLKAVQVATDASDAVSGLRVERVERTDQSCRISEDRQQDDIRGLAITYDYLLGLTPKQRRTPLNALLIRELPQAEADAREDDAPPFCDDPRVGLPEPDPKIPERPEGLR